MKKDNIDGNYCHIFGRNKKFSGIFYILVLMGVLFLVFLAPPTIKVYVPSPVDDPDLPIPRTSEIYPRISITGDEPLDWEPFSDGGLNDGTENSPYIISEKEIDAEGVGPSIEIINSTVYFIIINCTLENTGVDPVDAAILLTNVQNALIQDCDISGTFEHGIFLVDSSNNDIINNIIHDLDDGNGNGNGIFLENSNNIDITSGNDISNCLENGIILNDQCNENLISGNDISSNLIGIAIDNGLNNEILENIVYDNSLVGILLDQCVNTNLYSNAFSNNGINARDDYGINNQWDNGLLGNRWDDYIGNDQNVPRDHIGDTVYLISGTSGSLDNFPLDNSPLAFFRANSFLGQQFTLVSEDSSSSDVDPVIIYDTNGGIHIAWSQENNIVYRFKDAITGFWSPIEIVSEGCAGYSTNPAISVDFNGNVYIIWADNTNYANSGTDSDIFFRYKDAGNGLWNSIEVISEGLSGDSFSPTISVDASGNIHIAWSDFTDYAGSGTFKDIFYRHKDIGSGTWSSIEVLSEEPTMEYDEYYNDDPEISVDVNGGVHIIWLSYYICYDLEEVSEILYRFNDLGTGLWRPIEVLSEEPSSKFDTYSCEEPKISVDLNGGVHVVWSNSLFKDGTRLGTSIYYKYKNPNKALWDPIEIVSKGCSRTSESPAISVDVNGIVHVVWSDASHVFDLNYNFDIFYKFKYIGMESWSSIYLISEGFNENSLNPAITTDLNGNVYIVWEDRTDYAGSGEDLDLYLYSTFQNEYYVGREITFTFLGCLGDSPTSFEWDFGDDTPISNEVNPTHIYYNFNTFTVSLTLVDNDGDSDTFFKDITVLLGDYIWWTTDPEDEYIEYGTSLEYIVEADALNGIAYYWIDDELNFAIDGNGQITTTNILPIDSYPLNVRAYDNIGNFCEASIIFTVQDNTRPTWDILPEYQVLSPGDPLIYQVSASDLSGINYYWIDDTENFAIDATGMITNATILSNGIYDLYIEAYDNFDNMISSHILIKVLDFPSADFIIQNALDDDLLFLAPENFFKTTEVMDCTVDSSGNFHIVWIEDVYDASYPEFERKPELFYRYKNVETGQWSATELVSTESSDIRGPHFQIRPSLTVDVYGNIHVVWTDNTVIEDSGMDFDIFYKIKDSQTGLWSETEVVTTELTKNIYGDGGAAYPHIESDDDGGVHLMFCFAIEGEESMMEVYYVYKEDLYSSQWSEPELVSKGSLEMSFISHFSIDEEGNVHAFFMDNTEGIGSGDHFDIYYSCREKSSSSWSIPELLSVNALSHCYCPQSLIGINGNIHVFWFESGKNSIMYSSKDSQSGFWSIPEELSIDIEGEIEIGLTGYYSPFCPTNGPNGDIYLAFTGKRISEGSLELLYLVKNITTGTWSAPHHILPTITGGSLSPLLNYDNNGVMHISWLERFSGLGYFSFNPLCVGDTVEFVFTGALGNKPSTIEWNFGDGSPISHEMDAIHIYSASGNYTASLMVTDTDGEQDVYSKNIEILQEVGQIIWWEENPVDQAIELGITLDYDVNADGINGISYYWIDDNVNFAIDGNGLITTMATLPAYIYPLTIRAYDALNNYCEASITITVEDTISPIWDITPVEQVVELGDSLNYPVSASDLAGIDHYWISDETNFHIDGSGQVTSIIPLSVTSYPLVLRAYDPSNNYCEASITIQVQDTSAPTWDDDPMDQTISRGEYLDYQVSASDLSSIDHYWIDDTVNFAIDASGLLTNATILSFGTYPLEIRAYDPYNNFCSATITINADDLPLANFIFQNPLDPESELVSTGCIPGDIGVSTFEIDADGNIHVLWVDHDDYLGSGTDSDLFYRCKNSLTGEWGTIELVSTESTAFLGFYIPSISVDIDGNVHVVWSDRTDYMGSGTDYDIFYKYRDSQTGLWSDLEVLTGTSMGSSECPHVLTDDNGGIHVMWSDNINDDGFYDIYYIHKDDVYSPLWSAPEIISQDPFLLSIFPRFSIDEEDNIHVVWMDNTDGIGSGDHVDIFYSYKDNSIGLWSTPELISINSQVPSVYPQVLVGLDGDVHVFYNDGLLGELIYLCKDSQSGLWSTPEYLNTNCIEASISFYSTIGPNGDVYVPYYSESIGSSGEEMELFYIVKDVSSDTWSLPHSILTIFSENSVVPTLKFDDNGVLHGTWTNLDVGIIYHTFNPFYEDDTVQFTFTGDIGDQPSTIEWDFGDGSPISYDTNPSHVYNTAGTFTVSLTITDSDSDVHVYTQEVKIHQVTVDFSATPTSVHINEAVQFYFTGQVDFGPVTYEWDFNNDDIIDSTDQDPSWMYSTAGTYTVSLTIYDANSREDTKVTIDYITVTNEVPVADFTASLTSVDCYEDITFTFTGNPGDSPMTYYWDFGDGQYSSDISPIHYYENGGTFTVSLTITDVDSETSIETKTNYISVINNVPVANFEVSGTTEINSDFTLTFSGTLGDGTNEQHNFQWDTNGDGNWDQQGDGLNEITVNFGSAGTYAIKLRITDANQDYDEITINVEVTDSPGFELVAMLIFIGIGGTAVVFRLQYQHKKTRMFGGKKNE